MSEEHWSVILGQKAEEDFSDIIRWTTLNFGKKQADLYIRMINFSIQRLGKGPHIRGSRSRNDVSREIRTLPVADTRRRGRHFLLYRAKVGNVIEIVRILHDSMDLKRHLP
ncbi:MAG: type II toxin-antitoxin system RelE/ParE family toxin [Alphaproteobacteria bacterium]|nr:type II toxin-antitoxin system RelE/ParE family toxin [Alphaproteobacteria bacterium]